MIHYYNVTVVTMVEMNPSLLFRSKTSRKKGIFHKLFIEMVKTEPRIN